MTATQNNSDTILLVEPNRLSREGMARLFEECGYTIDGIHPDLAALIDQAATLNGPSGFCVIDASALSHDASADLARVRERMPETRIVILIDKNDTHTALSCFLAGADGCLIKDVSTDTMVNSLRLSASGERIFPSQMIATLLKQPALYQALTPRTAVDTHLVDPSACDLSDREVEVLASLVAGNANKEIAIQTGLSESTVKVHLRNILRKIGASNRTQAAIWAIRHGFAQEHQAA